MVTNPEALKPKAPKELVDRIAQFKAARVHLARQDVNTFLELVMKDERTGKAVKQSEMHKEWHQLLDLYDRLLVWAHVEAGKALALWTPIPTPDGWRTMGDLSVGDLVLDSKGAPCRVMFATPVQENRATYRVSFDDGAEIVADADHQWIVTTNDDARRKVNAAHSGAGPLCACGCGLRTAGAGKKYVHNHHGRKSQPGGTRTVTTTQMLARGVSRASGAKRADGTRYPTYNWRVPLAGAAQYPERTLSVSPYFLGAWLGDGNSSGPVLTGHVDDRFIYDRCVALEGGDCPPRFPGDGHILVGNVGGFRPKGRKRNDLTTTTARLRSMGVLNNKHIPAEYLTSSIEQRLELLAGLMDTDGSCDTRGRAEFCVCSERLATDTLELVRSLGIKASMTSSDAVIDGRVVGTRWRINFTPVVPVFKLPRKLARQRLGAEKFGRASYRCVVAIEPIASEPVRCIGVDSLDSSYLCGRSYTVTHNSSNLVIGRTLWELGRNPNLRFAICSNTYGQSEKMVRSIGRYIERSEMLHEVFPDLVPGTPWSSNSLTVKRKVQSKDASIQAVGVHGNILGARIDRLILDDILDYENTRTEAQREDLIRWVQSTLFGRLTADARVLCVGTAWHPRDLYHALSVQWPFKRYPVIRDEPDDPLRGQPRWPEVWPIGRVEKKRQELSPLEFARQLLCVARDDESARFKREYIESALQRGNGRSLKPLGFPNGLPRGYKTYTGVDLAVSMKDSADLTVLFTILLHPDGTREVLDIESGRWGGPEIVQRIVSVHRRYDSIVWVESNAAQAYLIQFARAGTAVPIRSFTTTGANKSHPEFGFETLATEMNNGKWIIPNDGGRMQPEVAAWVDELLQYDPRSHTGDRAMASWIAREGARAGDQKVERSHLNLSKR